MSELTKTLDVTLREAANVAYQKALAPIHTKIVQGVITAGLLALPSRDSFLERIEETEESAKIRALELLPLVNKLVEYVESLYDEPMPVSQTWFIST